MFIEISQMQRLIVFLGHPTYGLSVVLFSLLVASGAGSYATGLLDNRTHLSPRARLIILIGTLIVFGLLTPHAISMFQSSTTPIRIVVAAAILLPLGFFMGMAFPLGMQMAVVKSSPLMPWLWGINGPTSVLASVLAVVIAMAVSISASFWTGVGCYGMAFVAFLLNNNQVKTTESVVSSDSPTPLLEKIGH